MKVWARIRNNGEYHADNIARAVAGFHYFGIEIMKYQTLNEILPFISEQDIVLDYLHSVQEVFYHFGKSIELEAYPEVLRPYLGRKIWKTNIDEISSDSSKWDVFIKPVQEKLFQGRIVKSLSDLVGCSPQGENVEILCSEIVDIKREFRGFVYNDRLIDMRPYYGDWHYNYNANVIDSIMRSFLTWENRPAGCAIDFAVIEKNGKQETVFLELNDGYALGDYGLKCWDYAKLISARWAQIMNRNDELNFDKV